MRALGTLATWVSIALGACLEARGAGDVAVDLGPESDAVEAVEIAAETRPEPDSGTDTVRADSAIETEVAGSEVVSDSPAMRLHVIDVGQGDAVLVELPCGAMLIDAGGEQSDDSAAVGSFDSDVALEGYVRAFFARRADLHGTFDLVVLSHPHIDHTRGVTRLLAMAAAGEIVIRNVVTNGAEGSGSGVREQRALHDYADQHPGIGRWYVLERKTEATGLTNDVIDPFPAPAAGTCGDVDPTITALWGRVDNDSTLQTQWSDADLDNDNNHSVALRLDFGAASALFTGDLEEAAIAGLVARYGASGLLDVDVYKAGHHGSHNGTTAALVNAMSPALAVISAGPVSREGDWTAWSYGHPRWRAVRDLLGDNDSDGVSLYRPFAIDAQVATDYENGQGVFETKQIARAVYSTGWEGRAVVVTLHADGTLALPE